MLLKSDGLFTRRPSCGCWRCFEIDAAGWEVVGVAYKVNERDCANVLLSVVTEVMEVFAAAAAEERIGIEGELRLCVRTCVLSIKRDGCSDLRASNLCLSFIRSIKFLEVFMLLLFVAIL